MADLSKFPHTLGIKNIKKKKEIDFKIQKISKKDNFIDSVFISLTKLSSFLVLLLVSAIILSLVAGSWQSLWQFGLDFFKNGEWDPVKGIFGGLAPMYGTIVSSTIALFIAMPISLAIALFLSELCPNSLKKIISTAIELLAAIPSIIYGMWGLFVFVPWFSDIQSKIVDLVEGIFILEYIFAGPSIGLSVFTAGVVLSIMIIPFIASTIREVFAVVPSMLKESAYGLGATTFEVFKNIMLPFSGVGVFGAMMLGLGRALGETMAVTFVIGNAYNYSGNLFDLANTISSALANEFAEAQDALHISALVELALILFLISFIVLIVNKAIVRFMSRKWK